MQVYTIGHSNHAQEQFLKLLTDTRIQVLVDVRSKPNSRWAMFANRNNLKWILASVQIKYVYLGNVLGGRPEDPTCYKNGELPEGSADYLHLVDYPAVMMKDFFQKGIQRLHNLANQGRVALMCSEEDPAQCHRHHLIGRYLIKQGVILYHIRRDGNMVKDQQLPTLADDPPAEQLNLF